MDANKLSQRLAGILLHPTSLPSGKLDRDVERWLDLLSDSGLNIWQVLPLCEPQIGLSPYQCTSAFALNPALLPEDSGHDIDTSDYEQFCHQEAYWLDDYALFKVLKNIYHRLPWTEWPAAIKFREKTALERIASENHEAIHRLKTRQFKLHQRWHMIKKHAEEKNIILFGDMPIFVGHDSADVWANPQWFQLDDDGYMTVVTGVPPDYFSETGQRWGNPHYDWASMQQDGFSWWKSRIHHHLQLFDLVRIDHFRGLEAVWMIDADSETAIDGHWQKVPGDELLTTLKQSLEECSGHLPFVAEDLGLITPEVIALRKKYQLPGMSILQFGFDHFDDNPHKLKNVTRDMVVYTGTHDNNTTKGWYESLPDYDKKTVLAALNLNDAAAVADKDVANVVVNHMIESAMKSPADICIFPMQDIMKLGSEARMNTPGTIEGNWKWMFEWSQVDLDNFRILREHIVAANRLID